MELFLGLLSIIVASIAGLGFLLFLGAGVANSNKIEQAEKVNLKTLSPDKWKVLVDTKRKCGRGIWITLILFTLCLPFGITMLAGGF